MLGFCFVFLLKSLCVSMYKFKHIICICSFMKGVVEKNYIWTLLKLDLNAQTRQVFCVFEKRKLCYDC